MAASDWSERTKMIVTVSVAVVINLGLGYWLYSAFDTYKGLEKINKTKQGEIAKLKKIVNDEWPVLQAELAQLKRDLAGKESKLPTQNDVEKLIEDIGVIAQTTGANLLSSSKSGTSQEGGPGTSYERTIYRTRWKSDFMSWCKLLNAMEEHFPRFVAFENLTLNVANSGMVPTGTKHEINVDVVVYKYLRQQ